MPCSVSVSPFSVSEITVIASVVPAIAPSIISMLCPVLDTMSKSLSTLPTISSISPLASLMPPLIELKLSCASLAMAFPFSNCSRPCLTSPDICTVRFCTSLMMPPICPAESFALSASFWICSATTANPRPASPALAASMLAFRESRFVSSDMSVIVSTMSVIWRALVSNASAIRMISCITPFTTAS